MGEINLMVMVKSYVVENIVVKTVELKMIKTLGLVLTLLTFNTVHAGQLDGILDSRELEKQIKHQNSTISDLTSPEPGVLAVSIGKPVIWNGSIRLEGFIVEGEPDSPIAFYEGFYAGLLEELPAVKSTEFFDIYQSFIYGMRSLIDVLEDGINIGMSVERRAKTVQLIPILFKDFKFQVIELPLTAPNIYQGSYQQQYSGFSLGGYARVIFFDNGGRASMSWSIDFPQDVLEMLGLYSSLTINLVFDELNPSKMSTAEVEKRTYAEFRSNVEKWKPEILARIKRDLQ